VRVRILTNSLAATDFSGVHGAYARYREKLLAMGVEIYEFNPGLRPKTRRHGASASKLTSMHVKAYVFDQKWVCVGSFNADPRSICLNTELGLLVESPELAKQVCELFDEATQPAHSYRLALRDGRLAWIGAESGQPREFFHEPKASLWRRFSSRLWGVLPMEDEL
jgi:cardiolipin synthase C